MNLMPHEETHLMLNGARKRAVRTPMSRRLVAAAQAARAVRGVGRKVIL
ncbi:MAG: hypothetical protein RL655_638 [Pseudomonadota bacterium]|jgi:hypothetical protein